MPSPLPAPVARYAAGPPGQRGVEAFAQSLRTWQNGSITGDELVGPERRER